MNQCRHHRVKKNYPFGRKSKSEKFCKDCGEVISNKQVSEKVRERRKNRGR